MFVLYITFSPLVVTIIVPFCGMTHPHRISRLFFNKHINGTKKSEIAFHITIASPKTSEIKISNHCKFCHDKAKYIKIHNTIYIFGKKLATYLRNIAMYLKHKQTYNTIAKRVTQLKTITIYFY